MPNPAFEFRFVVDGRHHGRRIDSFLTSRLRNHASAALQRLIRAELVRVDDLPCGTERRVQRGEVVTLWLAEPPRAFYPAEPRHVAVLYEDPWIIAVNKPAGMLAHPAGPVGGGTLANHLQARFDRQTRHGGLLRPGMAHRLDRQTSGVIVVAKDQESHAGLTRQFERARISKLYCALAEGHVLSETGVIDRPIGFAPAHAGMSTGEDAEQARAARTAYQVVRRLRSATLLLARPRTGRKHQIRVHLASEGHPIVGDSLYAGAPRGRRHALHALAIGFQHPITGATLRVEAPLPRDFWETLGPG